MKGKIDREGYLQIERKVNYKPQHCPIAICGNLNRINSTCGDWCPLFGEPLSNMASLTAIEICTHRILIFDEFEDER